VLPLARLCKEEPMSGFGPGIVYQELYYSVTFECGKLSIVRRRISHCVLSEFLYRVYLLRGETLQTALSFLVKATHLWVESWGVRLSVHRLFKNAVDVSVCIAREMVGAPLNLLIFFVRKMLHSITVLIKGLFGRSVWPERRCAWRGNCGDRFCRVISPLQCR